MFFIDIFDAEIEMTPSVKHFALESDIPVPIMFMPKYTKLNVTYAPNAGNHFIVFQSNRTNVHYNHSPQKRILVVTTEELPLELDCMYVMQPNEPHFFRLPRCAIRALPLTGYSIFNITADIMRNNEDVHTNATIFVDDIVLAETEFNMGETDCFINVTCGPGVNTSCHAVFQKEVSRTAWNVKLGRTHTVGNISEDATILGLDFNPYFNNSFRYENSEMLITSEGHSVYIPWIEKPLSWKGNASNFNKFYVEAFYGGDVTWKLARNQTCYRTYDPESQTNENITIDVSLFYYSTFGRRLCIERNTTQDNRTRYVSDTHFAANIWPFVQESFTSKIFHRLVPGMFSCPMCLGEVESRFKYDANWESGVQSLLLNFTHSDSTKLQLNYTQAGMLINETDWSDISLELKKGPIYLRGYTKHENMETHFKLR